MSAVEWVNAINVLSACHENDKDLLRILSRCNYAAGFCRYDLSLEQLSTLFAYVFLLCQMQCVWHANRRAHLHNLLRSYKNL